jgi:TatD DNase family protein
MFDAHNHLDRCEDPLGEAQAAARCGVDGMLVAGVDPPGWEAQARLSGIPGVLLAYGLHPWAVAAMDEAAVEEGLEALARRLDRGPVAALGELGLDRSRAVDPASLDRQERAFRAQLRLARARDLPVVLHIVRAHGRALSILRQEGLPARGGMVHSTSTPPEELPRWLELGLCCSFSGSVTRHPRAREAAARVPLDRLLAETDAPDQPPLGVEAPNRVRTLGLVVQALAELHAVSFEEMAMRTAENARRVLGA